MKSGEAFRLLLMLAFGLLAGSELARHYAPREDGVTAANSGTKDTAAPKAGSDDAKSLSDRIATLNHETPSHRADDASTGGPNPEADGEEQPTAPDFDPEVVMYDQHRQMSEAIAKLQPHTPGKADVYFVAFGGDGGEDVFRNETEYAERLMSTRFDLSGHTLALVNNPATVQTHPLATWSNLELALSGIEKAMDPEEDVLVLFLTSHGGADHTLLVDLDPLPLDQIGAEDLSEILGKHAFRWKVVVVSACYSGGFVAPLKNSTTMVITASRADRTSFGCGADSDITWFGRAFFVEGLNQSDSFVGAFDIAKRLIDEWETRDGEEHSEPQIASTPLIEAKLREWRGSIKLGPTVPFVAPAAAGDTLTAKR
jgi:hypothetical protein